MWATTSFGNDFHKLICALLYDRFVTCNTVGSESGCPMLAPSVVDVPWLNEKQTVAVDFSRDVRLTL